MKLVRPGRGVLVKGVVFGHIASLCVMNNNREQVRHFA